VNYKELTGEIIVSACNVHNTLRCGLLEKILYDQFPNATIAVIRGYNNFFDEAYTKDVFFNEDDAKTAMAEIPPGRALPDTYHLITGKVRDLNEGKISDKRTQQPLDFIERSMIYDLLQEKLTK